MPKLKANTDIQGDLAVSGDTTLTGSLVTYADANIQGMIDAGDGVYDRGSLVYSPQNYPPFSILPADVKYKGFTFMIDGGGSPITTGIKGYIELPWNISFDRYSLLSDLSGSITVEFTYCTYANFPTMSAWFSASIGAANKYEYNSANFGALSKGYILRFNVTACSTIQRCAINFSGHQT